MRPSPDCGSSSIAAKNPQPGIVDRAAVIGMRPDDLTPTERDFFLDLIEALDRSVKPELDAYRYAAPCKGPRRRSSR